MNVTDPSSGATIKYGESADSCTQAASPTIKNVSDSPKTVYFKVTAENYADYTGSATITISEADAVPATVTANNSAYDGTAHQLISEDKTTLVGGDMQYALGENGSTAPTTGWSTSIPTGTNVGTYCVWYKVIGDRNHNDTAASCTTVTISPAPITDAAVTLSAASLAFTDSEQSVTVSSVKIGETTLTEGTDYEVSGATTGTTAGICTVTVTGKGNYTDSAAAVWSILPVDMTAGAEDVTVSYDGQPHGIVVNVTDPADGAVVRYGTAEEDCTLEASPTITNAKDSPLTIYYKITADNYNDKTGSAVVTITDRSGQSKGPRS